MSETCVCNGCKKDFFDEVSIVNYSKNWKPRIGFLNKLFNLGLNEMMFLAIEYFTLH